MKIRILHDPENFYEDGYEMNAQDLVNDYKDGLTTDSNDLEMIDWLNKVSDKNGAEFVCQMWGITYEIV